tara:strand:- start:240 stop:581 length:342 start_codon:yes stop_codon:yes gene_type:complete
MVHDACYSKVMASYGKWSARAAQAVAKCRKSHGAVKKTKAGANLRRWGKEKWIDVRTGKPCGHDGPGKEYCRPSKRISKKTPTTAAQISKASKRKNIAAKRAGGTAPKALRKK